MEWDSRGRIVGERRDAGEDMEERSTDEADREGE